MQPHVYIGVANLPHKNQKMTKNKAIQGVAVGGTPWLYHPYVITLPKPTT
jgi:hypothetical protein